MGAPTPTEILVAIASSAASGNITNPIPFSPTGTNAASIQLGYPPVTMEPENSGGEPPLGPDENGFLNLLSSHVLALEAGQGYEFSSSLASALTGYDAGAILSMTDGAGQWLNRDAGNTSNPDSGGAGWVPLTVFGAIAVALTTGVVTLTATQYKYGIIAFVGTLTGNVTINLPNISGFRWLFINGTTGSFSVTVQTAVSGSTGVTLPQAGPTQPVGVYSIGDNNIYPVVAPLSVATAVSPTPNTLVERDSNGYGYFAFVNSDNTLENPSVGAVVVENSSADGFFRKISLANFIAQLAGSQLLAGNGYVTLPGGLIIQWGSANPNGGSVAVTFPRPGGFPTSAYVVIAISIAGGAVQTWLSGSPSTTGFTLNNTGGSSFWIALGK